MGYGVLAGHKNRAFDFLPSFFSDSKSVMSLAWCIYLQFHLLLSCMSFLDRKVALHKICYWSAGLSIPFHNLICS